MNASFVTGEGSGGFAAGGGAVRRPAWWRRYLVAIGLVLAAAVLTILLRQFLSSAVFLFFYPAVIVAAWYGGFGPGALTALLAIVTADYLFVAQRVGFVVPTVVDLVLFAMFLVLAGLTSMLASRARTALAAAAEAERVARQASAAKSEFLAVMSHELRTPLNAIMGYTDLLDLGVGGTRLDGPAMMYLERVRGSVLHLRALIDQVLSLSQIEAGREDVHRAPVALGALVAEAAEMCRPQATEKSLSLTVDAAPDACTADTDASKVRQVLLNLLTNAVKFTDAGTITVSLRCEGAVARIEVRDPGIGIAPADHERVFEPFTQVDQSRTRRGGGIGLGLPVSRRLAELLGGTLTLASTPGVGSTFVLTLPLHPPAAR